MALVRTDVSTEHITIRSVLRLRITGNDTSAPILVTVMMEAILLSESSVLTRSTRCHIREYGILR
jgi:hypothetical protein